MLQHAEPSEQTASRCRIEALIGIPSPEVIPLNIALLARSLRRSRVTDLLISEVRKESNKGWPW